MVQRLAIILILFLILYPVSAMQAQETDPPPGDGWRATYWNNPSLAGFWRVQQIETEPLDRNWGEDAPFEEFSANYWSARWERTIQVSPGNYRFTVTVDNGIRVFVDEELVIDAWASQWLGGGGTFFGDVYLGEGGHRLTVEFFDATGPAAISLDWEPFAGPPPTVEGWLAEYYNNVNLSGEPVLIRDEPEIQANLQGRSPAPGTVNADNFSARWTRDLDLPAGVIEFAMRVDDGGRLLVGGDLILDGWRPQGPTLYTATVDHGGGPLPVTMEYFERTGYVVAELSWQRIADLPDEAQADPVPTSPTAVAVPAEKVSSTGTASPSAEAVIVDDGGRGFVWGNPLVRRLVVDDGYDGDSLAASNHQTSNNNYAWGRWYPDIPAGQYEVFAFIPPLDAGSGQATTSARYWVQHASQYTLRLVDQTANAGRWVSLGVYEFRGNQREYVSLADVTGEATDTTFVLWDAVRWESIE